MTHKLSLRVCALLISIILLLSLVVGCKPVISLNEIPEYSGKAYVEINGGKPYFTEDEITTDAFEKYSELDILGRCGVAFACIGIEIMPTEQRGDIASVTPTGWEYCGISNNNTYDFVENGYVYNRCHLIGFQLAGENDNEKNLITGTRYLNIEGMLPFENEIADYVETTENHVMYRVTPIFNGYDYVARGVLMEGLSVEDNGRGICFCIFAYNVQPGVTIDYFTGVNVESSKPLPEIDTSHDDRNETNTDKNEKPEENKGDEENNNNGNASAEDADYVINKNSGKFHTSDSSCVGKINSENREYYHGTKEELLAEGYTACKICKP